MPVSVVLSLWLLLLCYDMYDIKTQTQLVLEAGVGSWVAYGRGDINLRRVLLTLYQFR